MNNMRSMKSSVYRYARRQAKREFNRAYYSYSRNKNGNGYGNTKVNNAQNSNVELSDRDIIIGACAVIGILFFMAFMLSL
jgi:hypothetical protein